MERTEIAPGIFKWQNDDGLCSNVYELVYKDKPRASRPPDTQREHHLLIDAGDGSYLFPFTPDYCLLTHGHFDHAIGVKHGWKNVYIASEDHKVLPKRFLNAPEHAKNYPFSEASKTAPPFTKNQGALQLTFGPFQLEIFPTPGHTPGCVCILEQKSGLLFSGDTKFAGGGYGRTDLGGNDKQLQESLRFLAGLSWKKLCPGHGPTEARS